VTNGSYNGHPRAIDAFFGPNAGYVLDLYERYLIDPQTVEPGVREFFATLRPEDLAVVAPAATGTTNGAAVSVPPVGAAPAVDVRAVVGAVGLANGIREYGHLAVQLDPLGSPPPGAPELEAANHRIAEGDLARLPAEVVGGPAAEGAANAAEAIARLRAIYMGAIGWDFDSDQDAGERAWLREAVETDRFAARLDNTAKAALLNRLTEVEGFERFLHQTYLGQKRFSIEGNDVLVPMLDEIIHEAATHGTREIVLGMAHRGRLNVLTHILGKPYEQIIRAFEGKQARVATPTSDVAEDLTGDVKYHLGAKRARSSETGELVEVPLILAYNPSHLEFVNPVVEGMVRASQDQRDQAGPPRQDIQASMAILLHGDASFPGQGIVAETLNLSRLNGYKIGGSIHIIVNNQIGYTTDWHDSRSTLYAGDLAKGFEIPIVHVKSDDPDACLTAARFALAYRETFQKDVLIDLVGYRRWGHNEGDEPAFTQPRMYDLINRHPTVRAQLANRLVAEGIITTDEAVAMEKAVFDRLSAIKRTVSEGEPPEAEEPAPRTRHEVETAVPVERLRELHDTIHDLEEGFTPNPKLARQWERRKGVLDTTGGKIDWAHAEALAFASLLADGTPIRLTGQDAERGTFSQRHLVLHDARTGARHVPLQELPQARASFAVYNSPLAEAAAIGFEYGYDVQAETVLTLWEAQFGDFANGGQVLIDQFLVAARQKWDQKPALVLLLPHGYEGQGPEHSSARLERFLQLSARDNIRVANCTTAAQYFHVLRRQAALLDADPHPLILMTPKSLLRNPAASCLLEDLGSGTFQPVLDDPTAEGRRDDVSRLVLCSGKVFYDLLASDAREATPAVAIARVEQLAPFQNTALRALFEAYPNLAEVFWVQEEPRNMGAWSYMEPRLRDLLRQGGRPFEIGYVGRPDRASPAEGSLDQHNVEQARIVAAAFANAPTAPAGAKTNGRVRANGVAGATAATAAPKRSKTKAKTS
jgi:2-oxoglutarate dehydrogenase E1 component